MALIDTRKKCRTGGFRHNYLLMLTTIAAFLGYLPVENLQDGIFRRKYNSNFGVWCLCLLVVHIFGMYNAIACIAVQAGQTATGSGPTSIFKVGGTLLPTVSYIYLVEMYLVYIFWLWSLPKFLEAWKRFKLFDEKYTIGNLQVSSGEIGLKAVQAIIFVLEIYVTAAGFVTIVRRIEDDSIFKSVPWISLFNLGIGSMSWFIGIHLCACQFATGLAIQFILEMANRLNQRMDSIMAAIQEPISLKHIARLHLQIVDLMDIFTIIQDGSKFVILVVLSFATVLVTVYIFVIVVNLSDILLTRKEEDLYVLVNMVLYFVFASIKVLLLSNTGEYLLQQGNRLRSTMLRITTPREQNTHQILDLKLLALDINFQLSGSGYFNLNRSAITAILSSIITYNVVLAQFENTK